MKHLYLILFLLCPITVFGANGQNVHLQDANGLDFGSQSNPIHVNLSGAGSTAGINSAGNVGINTTDNTVSALNVNGTVTATALDLTGTGDIAFRGNVGINTTNINQSLTIIGNFGIGTSVPNTLINQAIPDGGVYIQGNVGIGTPVPDQRLVIAAPSTSFSPGIVLRQTGGQELTIGENTGTTFTQGLSNDGSNRTAFDFTTTGHNDIASGHSLNGLRITASGRHTATGSSMTALQAVATPIHTSGTNDNIYGVRATNNINGAGGTTTNSYAFFGDPATVTAGTLTRNYAGGFNGWTVFPAGNIGIGTVLGGTFTQTSPPLGGAIIEGNVGIGSLTPGTPLDVAGIIRSTTGGFTFPDNTTQTTAGSASQWATQNTTDVSLAGGNVGIGTTKTTTSALTVMNGNVGIGTWIPNKTLVVTGNGSVSGTLLVSGVLTGATTINASNGSATLAASAITGLQNSGIVTVGNEGTGATSRLSIEGGKGSGSSITLSPNNGTVTGVTDFLQITTGNVGLGTIIPFYLQSNGNIGMGTVLPGSTLDVFGSIRSVQGASVGVGACWCTTPAKVLGYCTGALGTCSACNYNGSGC